MQFEIKSDRSALRIVLFAVVVALLPFVFASVPDDEEFYATAMPMTLAYRALSDLNSPFWTPLLGLGVPQPFRISYLLHPLGPAFGLHALAGVNMLTSVHLAMGAIATYFLATYLGTTRLAAVVCAVTAVFSTTIAQLLYVDDWFTHVVTWSLLPVSALLLLRLLDSKEARSAAFFALALGLTVGFQIATGLITRSLCQLLLIAPLAAARPRATFQKFGWLAAAGAIALVGSAANWVPLLDEFSHAVATAARSQHTNFPLTAHLWGAWVQPFAVLGGIAPRAGAETWRVVGFGPVLALLALVQLFRRPANENARAIYVGFGVSIVYMVLPPGAYLNLVTATWVFRDGINFYGILLGGLLLSSFRPRAAAVVGAIQCVLLLIAVEPLWKPNLMRAFEPGQPGSVTASDLGRSGDVISALRASAAGHDARFLFAPGFTAQLQRFAADGIGHNTLAYHGLRVVDVFARGIATSSLHPDPALLEGFIRAGPTTLFDVQLLNVLGITHVLAMPDDRYGASLVAEQALRSRNGSTIVLLRNRDAWPAAVFVDDAAARIQLPRRSGCGHDRFFCADFRPVVEHRVNGPPISIEQRHGSMVITLAPSGVSRTVMVSTWFRPGWRADRAGVSVFPVFEQLTGVRIPAGVGEVRLAYWPAARLWAHVASAALFLVGGVALVLLGVARRRTSRGSRAARR